jgi:hypothetical protein
MGGNVMNGIVPGPLWLMVASAVSQSSLENGTLIHHSKNDTVAGKRAERDDASTNCRAKTGVDGDVITASRETSEMHRSSMLAGGIGAESEERHGTA